MRVLGFCDFCGDPVTPDHEGTYHRVTGWVKVRKGGGAHAIELATPPQALAHAHCVKLAKTKGETPATQEVMFGG